jgi:hypothetical protein
MAAGWIDKRSSVDRDAVGAARSLSLVPKKIDALTLVNKSLARLGNVSI